MKEYTITSDSGMETTVLLSDEDAKARGLSASDVNEPASKQATPANKAAAPQDKGR